MMITPPLSQAIELVGLRAVADACGVTYQAVRKWEKTGRLPRTEWTGETDYAERIERATEGRVTKAMLLEKLSASDSEKAAA